MLSRFSLCDPGLDLVHIEHQDATARRGIPSRLRWYISWTPQNEKSKLNGPVFVNGHLPIHALLVSASTPRVSSSAGVTHSGT